MNRPMFPHVIDSTMLSAGAGCLQKLYLSYIQHWKPVSESVHLVAGGAFAKGCEVARTSFFEQGMSTEDSYAAGAKALFESYGDFEAPTHGSGSAKTLDRMLGALEFYFEQYPFGEDGMQPITMANGRRGIEFSFAEPLPINHPVTGDPILFAGRADLIADFAGGRYIVDEKTASSLGPSWSKQWEMRGQFTGYQWAAGQAHIACQGSIIRGVSILKTKYETQQAITYRSPWELDRWLNLSVESIERWIRAWDRGQWNHDVSGTSCQEYGGCSFTRVCKSSDPQPWLEMYFKPRVWDPLGRREVTVDEFHKDWNHVV